MGGEKICIQLKTSVTLEGHRLTERQNTKVQGPTAVMTVGNVEEPHFTR